MAALALTDAEPLRTPIDGNRKIPRHSGRDPNALASETPRKRLRGERRPPAPVATASRGGAVNIHASWGHQFMYPSCSAGGRGAGSG